MSYNATLRGLTLGDGTDYEWSGAPEGLGLGVFTSRRLQISARDGAFPLGPDLLQPRRVTFNLEVWGGAGGTLQVESLVDALRQAWGPVRTGVIPLTIELAGPARLLFGRPVSLDVDLSPLTGSFARARARCVFEATDPRLLSASSPAIVLGLVAGGGMTFPLTFPLTFGAGSDSDGVAANVGTVAADWTATITGPVTSPTLTLGSTGQVIELDGTVPSGSTLVVDSGSQSILLDGSPRQSWLTLRSRWWQLPSGSSTVRFRAASGSGSCSFAWRSAWL